MADNLTTGDTGSVVAFDDISSVFYARQKLIHGADGTNDGDVSTANPLPVRLYVGTTATNLGGGVESGALRVTVASDSTGVLSVDDNGASLTVDNGGTFVVQVDGTALTRLTDIETNTDSGAVVGNGAAATAQRVTLANDSTGVLATVTNVATIGTSVTPGSAAAHLG